MNEEDTSLYGKNRRGKTQEVMVWFTPVEMIVRL